MVQVKMTADEFAAKAKQLSDEQGIHLTGNQGEVSKSGVTVGYGYDGSTLTLTVMRKPFIVSKDYCETQMKQWLGVA